MQSQANILSFDDARRAAADAHGASPSHAADTRRPPRHGASASKRGERVTVSAEGDGPTDGAGAKAESKPLRPKPSWYTAASDARTASVDADDIFLKDEPAARTSRFADDDSFDADLEEQLEEALEKKKGPLASLRSKAAKSKHARVKEKAGKAYFKQYEADKASDGSQGGPRAAVYKGEMGASHKRSARMQNTAAAAATASSRSRSHGVSAAEEESHSTARKVLGRMGFVGVALLLTAAFLYGPAQRLYVDIRERDRLAVEYELVTARNEAISEHVEALQTEDGVEDVARAELGWVREGEHAVSVSNLNLDDNSDFQSNIVSEDVPMPETWYSVFLDPLFGVK